MNIRRKSVAIVAGVGSVAAIAIAIFMYFFTPFGAIPLVMGSQLVPWNAEFYTEQAEKIVIGKVISVEKKVAVDTFSYTDPATGQLVSREDTRPYYFVTIEVERYLVDKAGEYPPVLTYRDPHVNGIFFIDGKKVDVISEYSSEYEIGERAMFFIYRSDDKSALESSAVNSKFTINENNGTVQSLQLKRTGDPPMKLANLEKEINAVLTKTNATSIGQ